MSNEKYIIHDSILSKRWRILIKSTIGQPFQQFKNKKIFFFDNFDNNFTIKKMIGIFFLYVECKISNSLCILKIFYRSTFGSLAIKWEWKRHQKSINRFPVNCGNQILSSTVRAIVETARFQKRSRISTTRQYRQSH